MHTFVIHYRSATKKLFILDSATEHMPDTKILSFLSSKKGGATLSEIAQATGHGRATVGKYLELLKVQGRADFSGVGMAKVWFLNPLPRILVVDDEPGLIRLVRLSLREYDIVEAQDGVTALEKVKSSTPDLIILDIMIPRLSGTEVCRILKENPVTRGIPVLMLTAKDELKSRISGIKLGADDYMAKPFDVIELRARVNSLLRKDGGRNPVTNLPEVPSFDGKDSVVKVEIIGLESYRQKQAKVNEFMRIIAQVLVHSCKGCDISHNGNCFYVASSGNLSKTIRDSLEEIVPFLDIKAQVNVKVLRKEEMRTLGS